jgi:dTDP-4-dehydrorhamnose 3,5-epimerase
VVDIRRGSPSYGAHVVVELSAENWRQIYVPEGMAHGYCTLSDVTEVLYKTSAEYAPASEGGLLWNDPALAIAWPVSAEAAIVAERDRAWPLLADLATPFS